MSKLVVSTIETQNIKYDSDTSSVTIAADGTFNHKAPAGQVVQMKRVAVNTVTTTTSNTFSNHMSAQFDNTPTVGNLVIVSVSVTAYRDPTANWGSHCAVYIGSEGMSSGDTNFVPAGRATSGYAGADNYGSQGVVGNYIGNMITSTGHKTITASHVSGGNPTFYFKVNELGGGTTYWGAAAANTSHDYSTDITNMILWEIAQ